MFCQVTVKGTSATSSIDDDHRVSSSPWAGWYYDALNVSIRAQFSSSSGNPGYNPYPVLATPPIVPQTIWKQV